MWRWAKTRVQHSEKTTREGKRERERDMKEAHNLNKNKPLTVVIVKCCPKNPFWNICVTNEEFGCR